MGPMGQMSGLQICCFKGGRPIEEYTSQTQKHRLRLGRLLFIKVGAMFVWQGVIGRLGESMDPHFQASDPLSW